MMMALRLNRAMPLGAMAALSRPVAGSERRACSHGLASPRPPHEMSCSKKVALKYE